MPETATETETAPAPSRLLHNEKLRAEVIEHLGNNWPHGFRKWNRVAAYLHEHATVLKNLPKPGIVQPEGSTPPRDFIPESLDTPSVHLESIILPLARPVLFVQDNDFGKSPLQYWQDRLDPARDKIKSGIPFVGRIQLKNHDLHEWNGTAWLVRPDIAITNAHVAKVFASNQNGRWIYRANSSGKTIRSTVDFREEYQRPNVVEELDVVDIIHVEDSEDPDFALLRVKPDPARGVGIPLAASVTSGTEVATIGYPKYDTSIPDPPMMVAIFGGVYNVKRLAPGVVTDSDAKLLKHDCSTLGGNSGSTIISLATGEAVGLHFGGTFKKNNFAVPAPVISKLLTDRGL